MKSQMKNRNKSAPEPGQNRLDGSMFFIRGSSMTRAELRINLRISFDSILAKI